MPNGIFYYNSLHQFIYNKKGVWLVFIIIVFYRNPCI